MNLIAKSTWTVLFLGAAVGCAGDSETESPPAPVTNPGPTAQPARSPAKPASESPKETASEDAKAPAPSSHAKTGDTKKGAESPKVEGPKADSSKADSGADKLTVEELDAIKELPASEQDAARAQLTCPVSTDHLGSMGKPYKVTAEGRTFYLCCDNCEKKVKADPKKYIAILDAKKSGK
jgi:YHS domain-containing protein